MGEFLGALAGCGMLLLVAALLCVFLGECGALSRGRIKRLGHAELTTLGIAAAYFLTGALLYSVLYEPVDHPFQVNRIFCTAYLERMYESLRSPGFFAPLSGVFAYAGHAVGAALFGQYVLGGEALALLMTALGAWLLLERMTLVVGEKAAEEGLFLLLSLPGALFLFLPGWPPLIFLIACCGVFFLGKRWPQRAVSYSASAYAAVLAVAAVLSAVVVYLTVVGRPA